MTKTEMGVGDDDETFFKPSDVAKIEHPYGLLDPDEHEKYGNEGSLQAQAIRQENQTGVKMEGAYRSNV